jgi:hypothetical protein
MLIHDVNSLDAENKEALIGARRSVAMMRLLPQMVRLQMVQGVLAEEAVLAYPGCRLVLRCRVEHDRKGPHQGDASTPTRGRYQG